MKFTMKRSVAMILVVLYILTAIPAGTAFAEESSHSFYLMAATDNKMIISPVEVVYTEGMSIREALVNSGYEFEGIDANGMITAIEGYSANFSLFYDGGGYLLDEAASAITAIAFMQDMEYYSEEILSLIKLMGRYAKMDNNIHNYIPAQTIYEDALDTIRSAKADVAKEIYDNLSKAIADYEYIISGEKFTVTFNASKGDGVCEDVSLTLTDEYSNVTKSSSSSADVVAGNYSFVISDKGFNRTEGKITVNGDMSVDVSLPSGEWFSDIFIYDADTGRFPDTAKKYAHTQDYSSHVATYDIPDTVGKVGMYIYPVIGDVPDKENTRFRTIYTDTDGKDKSEEGRSWNDSNAFVAVLKTGMEGRKITVEAQYDNSDGYTMIQEFTLQFDRLPTLSSLSIKEGSTEILSGFDGVQNEYDVTTVSEKLDFSWKTYSKDYEVTVDGNDSGTVDLAGKTSYKAVIAVKSGDKTNNYYINITRVEPATVTMKSDSDVTVEVYNAAGSPTESKDGKVFELIAGEKYTYISTKNKYFHTTYTFTATDGMSVSVVTPDVKHSLTDFALYNTGSISSRIAYEFDKDFETSIHEYDCVVMDMNVAPYAQANAINGYSVNAVYNAQNKNEVRHGESQVTEITKTVDTDSSATQLKYGLEKSGYSQDFIIRLEKNVAGIKYYQDYNIAVQKSLHLNSLKTSDDLLLADKDGNIVDYDYQVMDYYIFVPKETDALTLYAEFPNQLDSSACCGGYYAIINGVKYDNMGEVKLSLDTSLETEDITIQVCHEDERTIKNTYTLHIIQQEPVFVKFKTIPEDAIIYVKNNVTGKRIPETDGSFALTPNGSYTYTVTRNGYVGVRDEEYTAPMEETTIEVELREAEKNDSIVKFDSWWSSFRADKNNNGIINSKTPVKNEDAVLYWATKIGDGFDKDACGCPIIVNGYLYTYAGNTIYKVDTVSGEVLETGEMDHSSSFAVNPPTYADGMIFIGLAEGCIQAFSADTLESLWIYRDELGGQPNCNIYYHDGYIYTGFWLGETQEANYVCLSVTDEDPTQEKEEKIPTWTYTSKGGFYWAGAYVNDNFAIVGTDDGDAGYIHGYGRVITFSTKTGKVIDEITMPNVGDIRSTIVYDEKADEYYFTSKGGYFYGLKVDSNGNIKDESLRFIRLENGVNIATAPAMSTSSPAVYNGRAYIGVSGRSQFGAYSGHNITVLDLENWEIAYKVQTQGYPQTSGIVSTAYEEENGLVYVYFIDNYTPGRLRVISDKPGQTKPRELTVESYTSGGKTYTYDTGYVLFTPDGNQAQYAICSPIVDEYGTIYFKNDSAYLMAIGSTIERIEITQMPSKLSYEEGEKFDPAGMKVTAFYKNGMSRDITEYVTFSDQPLTVDDTSFEIRYEKVMYQDRDNQAGQEYTAPIAFVGIEVIGKDPVQAGECDINSDGKVNSDDLSKALSEYLMTGEGITADINKDSVVDAKDISLIISNYTKSIS